LGVEVFMVRFLSGGSRSPAGGGVVVRVFMTRDAMSASGEQASPHLVSALVNFAPAGSSLSGSNKEHAKRAQEARTCPVARA
jgi:hypothetical protein